MSTWRRKAIEAAPELRGRIERCWSPMAAWIELSFAFERAAKGGDMRAAGRIMDYARYCLAAPNADVNTAVVVVFLESLAADEAVRARLPELVGAREARDWGEAMAYHAGHDAVAELIAACRERRERDRPPTPRRPGSDPRPMP